jgi:hypothetical protein
MVYKIKAQKEKEQAEIYRAKLKEKKIKAGHLKGAFDNPNDPRID